MKKDYSLTVKNVNRLNALLEEIEEMSQDIADSLEYVITWHGKRDESSSLLEFDKQPKPIQVAMHAAQSARAMMEKLQ